MDFMRNRIIQSLLRHALTALGTVMVSRGLLDAQAANDLTTILGGLAMTGAGLLWSGKDKKETVLKGESYESGIQNRVDPADISQVEYRIPARSDFEIKKKSVSGFMLSDRSRIAMEGINPLLMRVVETAIGLTEVDFAVTEGLRSAERQQELINAKKSWVKKSKHQDGNAIDVAAFPNGYSEVSWDLEHYAKINEAFQEAGRIHGARITWGGNWTQRDGVHFQIDNEIA